MIDMFNDVPAFVAVVEAGGFAAASRQLNLSRSAVGKAVARLEDRLGVRLFQRTTRSQSLTEDGQAFHQHCLRALAELQAGQALLESGHSVARGRLRVSMPVLFGRLCVAPVLGRLASLHPELALELNFNDRHVDLVEDGFDAAIRNGPLRDEGSLRSRRIARERTMIYAAPDYLARRGAPAALADLQAHDAVTYARTERAPIWQFPGAAPPFREFTPRTRLRFDDLGAVADAAVSGAGLAWLPDWLVRDRVERGALVRVLADAPALATDIHVVWPVAPHLPARVRVAIDALVEGAAGQEGRDSGL